MQKITMIITLILISVTAFTGCSVTKETAPDKTMQENVTDTVTDNSDNVAITSPVDESLGNSEGTTPILKEITAEEAKMMMEKLDKYVILDVRTEEEYAQGHIKGAILIPDYEVETKAEELLEDKSETLLIYCRSGRRSALAAEALNGLGYTSVYDFGGIIDWPYEIVTE